MTESRCGYVAIVGRSNVGKSTLLNAVLGEKLCITSRRLQTTRHKILGIKTQGACQTVYVDTPGWQSVPDKRLNREMNRAARAAWRDADVIAWMVDVGRPRREDELLLAELSRLQTPILLLVNKIDLLSERKKLLPLIKSWSQRLSFAAVIPVSAKNKDNVDDFERELTRWLPSGTHLFPPEQRSDRDQTFFAAEIVREKILRLAAQEVPHASAVVIEALRDDGRILHIQAEIWVEREGQKAILIGKGGEKLKDIGRRARLSLQSRWRKPVMLKLWVRVKSRWSDNAQTLRRLGVSDGFGD